MTEYIFFSLALFTIDISKKAYEYHIYYIQMYECVYIHAHICLYFLKKNWNAALHVFPHEKGETPNASN